MSHVLIVGAGPAGASLANLLVHRGIQVTLLERQRDFSREFRGEWLMPSGLEALEEMGLGPALAGTPSSPQESLEVYLNGRRIFREEFDPDNRVAAAVSQPSLLEMLVTEAGKSPGFRLERGASVKDLLVEGERIVGVRARTEEGDRVIHADLVIGADGRASVVRKRGDFESHAASPALDVVWCKLPLPADWSGPRIYAGRGNFLLVYRSWDDSLQLAWIILKGTFGELKSRGVEQWLEEMANHVSPDLAAHLRANLDAIKKPFLLDAASDCVKSWSVPGALLIGDAAHTMSPVGGQGINIALRDTIVAANHLVPILAEPTFDAGRLDAALRAIQDERMTEVARIQMIQAQPPKIGLNRAWWGEPLRWVAGVALRRARFRYRVARLTREIPFGVTDVKLSV